MVTIIFTSHNYEEDILADMLKGVDIDALMRKH